MESETLFIKEEPSELSTQYQDKLRELTKVEVIWVKQEKLHDMTKEMMDRLVIAKTYLVPYLVKKI